MTKKKTLLLDGDLILYAAAAANEKETNWGDDIWTLTCDHGKVKEAVTDTVSRICEELKSDRYVLCFSGGDNFRRKILDTYKSNRKDVRKPLGWNSLRQWCRENFQYFEKKGIEADDAMGILATNPAKQGNYIIVSDDKDMKTIPGFLYTGGKVNCISPDEADYWHMYQTLVGDVADGYKGCPGIGAKGAEKLLKPLIGNLKGMWEEVVKAFNKAGLTEDDALVQARVARILRWEDYDMEKQKVKFWTAPK